MGTPIPDKIAIRAIESNTSKSVNPAPLLFFLKKNKSGAG
jgi:hypothetical protein